MEKRAGPVDGGWCGASPYVLVGLAAIVVHAALLREVLFDPWNRMPGWPGDNLLFLWNLWWFATALDGGLNPLHCPLVHLPVGGDFGFHTNTLVYAALAGVLSLFTDDRSPEFLILVYNALVLLSSCATAVLLHGVIRCAMPDRGIPKARLVATLAATFCTFRVFAFNGHLNFLGTEFFVAAALCLWIGLQGGPLWPLLMGGIAGSAAFHNDQTIGVMVQLHLLLLLAARWLGGLRTDRLALRLGLFQAAFLLPTIPYAWHLLGVFRSPSYFVASAGVERTNNLLNLVLPSSFNGFVGGFMDGIRGRLGLGGGAAIANPGLLFWSLVCLAAWRWRGKWWTCGTALPIPVRIHAIVLGAALVLSLGEWLEVGSVRLIPLPFWLLQRLPVLDSIRVSERLFLIGLPSLAVLLAYGLERVSAFAGRRGSAAGLGVLVAAAIVAAAGASHMLPHTDVKGHVAALRASNPPTEPGVVIDFPPSYDESWQCLHQIVHGQPALMGRLARTPPVVVEAAWGDYWPLGNCVFFRQGCETWGRDAPDVLDRLLAVHEVRWILVPRAGFYEWIDVREGDVLAKLHGK